MHTPVRAHIGMLLYFDLVLCSQFPLSKLSLSILCEWPTLTHLRHLRCHIFQEISPNFHYHDHFLLTYIYGRDGWMSFFYHQNRIFSLVNGQ